MFLIVTEEISLLETHNIEMKAEFGAYGMARYFTMKKNGSRWTGALHLTINSMKSTEMLAPCVMLNMSAKVVCHGKAFYDITKPPSADLKKCADSLRSMPISSLLCYMTTLSWEEFEPGP